MRVGRSTPVLGKTTWNFFLVRTIVRVLFYEYSPYCWGGEGGGGGYDKKIQSANDTAPTVKELRLILAVSITHLQTRTWSASNGGKGQGADDNNSAFLPEIQQYEGIYSKKNITISHKKTKFSRLPLLSPSCRSSLPPSNAVIIVHCCWCFHHLFGPCWITPQLWRLFSGAWQ